MRSNQLAAIIITIITIGLLYISTKSNGQLYVYRGGSDRSLEPQQNEKAAANDSVRKLYQSWKRCMVAKTASFRGNHQETWNKIGNIVRECEQPFVQILNVKDFSNSDETKRHISPIQKNSTDKVVVITLGVGHDTAAEERLLKAMGNESLNFYGADPMVEVNQKLYSAFGKFFPFAVSAKPGFSIANVLEGNAYVDKLVIHVDAVYFLTKLIGLKFFDTIWMDAEGAEYELFPFINKGGAFDENEIIICQMNLEIHLPDDKKKKLTHDFLFETLDDERYAYFQPVQANHLRLFFVNFEDKMCTNKYIPKIDFKNVTLPF